MTSRILVVDDEKDIREIIQDILMDENHVVEIAADARQANEMLERFNPELVLLDIWMPDMDGISLLKKWQETKKDLPVIMISGHGNVETAVEAIQLGAYDFLEKPLSTAKLLVTVNRALEKAALIKENRVLKKQGKPLSDIIGSSAKIIHLRDQVEKVAPTDSRILIHGESGTDKRIVARNIHSKSLRSDAPMIEFNIAAVPEDTLARHLFGFEEEKIQAGRFEQAQGGSLYFDEINDIGQKAQLLLENVLEQRQYMRVGGKQFKDIDARVMSSSSIDLRGHVDTGSFRETLYYFLNVVPVHVPSLREHVEDIPELVSYYVDYLVEKENLPYRRFSTAAINVMRQYPWHGNNRELRNIIQRVLVFNSDEQVGLDEIQDFLGTQDSAKIKTKQLNNDIYDITLREAREVFEREYLVHNVRRAKGNIAEVAKLVGMERTHLYRKLKMLGIDPKLILNQGDRG